MKQTKQPNKFTFDKDTQECKRNGRKFGTIIYWDDKQIDVIIETKKHRGTGEVMTFKIVTDEDTNQN
jgi:hypothetical protein